MLGWLSDTSMAGYDPEWMLKFQYSMAGVWIKCNILYFVLMTALNNINAIPFLMIF